MASANQEITSSPATRRWLKRQLIRSADYVNQWSKANVADSFERLELCKAEIILLQSQFEESVRLAVEGIDPESEAATVKKQEDDLFKELDDAKIQSLSLIAKINGILKTYNPLNRDSLLNESTSSNAAANAAQPDIRLPKIEIPEFDGDPRKFMKFKTMFQNMIHEEPRITNVRKLIYLQRALTGKAEEFLRDVDITDGSNYANVWREFLARFENKRVIARTHFTDLFAIKQIKDESGLRRLLDEVTSSLRGLKACGENPDQWGSILCHLVLTKLDDITKRDFENWLTDKTKFPSFNSLKTFLENRATAAEDRTFLSSNREKPKPPVKQNQPDKNDSSRKSFSTGVTKCVACNSQHLLIECKVFLEKTPFERFELIKKNRLCINCFGRNHKTNQCRSRTCKTCNQKHHTMLHMEKPAPQQGSPSASISSGAEGTSAPPENTITKQTYTTTAGNEVILLPTAVVRFRCGTIYGKARVLFDPASEATMISDKLVRRFHLPITKSPAVLSISGVGDNPALSTHSCSLTLLSRVNQFQLPVNCYVVQPVAIKYEVSIASLNLLKSEADYVQFADDTLPYQYTDIILGAKYVEKCYLNQTIEVGEATLRNSVFGWLAIGAIPVDNIETTPSKFCYAVSHNSTIPTIEARLRRLCDSDEFYEPVSSKEEHTKCNEHFESTYQRNKTGKFVVFLPTEENETVLSDTRKMALSSLARIERSPPEVRTEYHKFITEYEELNHVRFFDADTFQSTNNYILPQLLVLRPDKSTTKLRTVFHASYKTRSGKSLNEILMTGPTLQLDIFDALVRFRRHPVGFAADIEKMYRQILVHPNDQHLQKIYYRSSPSAKLKVGVLQTITYGTSPASFIATKCLSILADEIEESNPHCAEVIRTDFYMDDLITGCDTIEEARGLQKAVSNQLSTAHFPLRKYSSNSPEFLQGLEPSLVEPLEYRDIASGNIKLLGLRWIPNRDSMSVVLKLEPLPTTITKRIMLSEIASIFDVLGILSPVTIRSKLLMQELWREKTPWDSPIPSELENFFRSYHSELTDLLQFSIPRHYESITKYQPFELVGFCDASDRAYCAVVYIRAISPDASPTLMCAKTKVAPIKRPTIPRLELQAAVLLARLIQRVTKTLSRTPSKISAFSDSTIVLSWLNKPPTNWKQYVKNRVTFIISILSPENWRYVNTKENPADLATRGISAKQFLSNELWLNGPSFIGHELPPPFNHAEESIEVTKEQKSSVVCHTTSASFECPLIKEFSSYQRLISTFAYVCRFAENSHDREVRSNRLQLLLTPGEIKRSKTALIRHIQKSAYASEIRALEVSNTLPQKSILLSLSPFLDEQNLLRVGGRLRKSDLPYTKQHPIILPAKSWFLELYIRHLHQRYFHATKSFIITFVNTEFWIVGSLPNVVKKVIHRCTTCIRYRGETLQQIMGQLPPERVTECDSFTHTGVDFAGPFNCKCTGHRSTIHFKAYIAIFVCMSSRAIHIEVVSNLTTAAFLDALKRFAARRGLPKTIWSDNGRNFVGASNYLDLTSPELAKYARSEGITWKFIPPYAPNYGGIWEAAVKSAKHHFHRVIKDQTLTFEEYQTFFSQTEAVLNSRPLCYRKADDKTYVAVTPAHLIIGRPLLTAIDGEPPLSTSVNARYALRETIFRSFWSSWRADYLNQLQAKFKWRYPSRNLQKGDVVLIKEDNLPPSVWPMAIVESTEPDKLGHVRTAHLKSTGGFRTRSVRQLVPLLMDEPDGSSPGSVSSSAH